MKFIRLFDEKGKKKKINCFVLNRFRNQNCGQKSKRPCLKIDLIEIPGIFDLRCSKSRHFSKCFKRIRKDKENVDILL